MRQNNGKNKIGVFEGIAYCIGDIIGSGLIKILNLRNYSEYLFLTYI